jgi:hypothetical protein
MVLEKQTLYWKLPLTGVRTQQTSSLKNTIFSSLVKVLDAQQKKLLVLSFENTPADSLIFRDFKFKLKTSPEVCTESKLYPEGFDCHRHCQSEDLFMKPAIFQILNFSFFGAFSPSRSGEFYSFKEPLLSNKTKCVRQCPVGYFANKKTRECEQCAKGCASCADPYNCDVCHNGTHSNYF